MPVSFCQKTMSQSSQMPQYLHANDQNWFKILNSKIKFRNGKFPNKMIIYLMDACYVRNAHLATQEPAE